MGNIFPLLVLTDRRIIILFHLLWNYFVIFVKNRNVILLNENKLKKLIKKNKGDIKLRKEVEELICVIRNANWQNKNDIIIDCPDADCVHSAGFYFFDVADYRSMILIAFYNDEAEIVWADNHDKYLLLFKNNKSSIERWLRKNGLI